MFIEVYKPYNKERLSIANIDYGITEVKPIPYRPLYGILRGRRVYLLTVVYTSVYLVPVDETNPNKNVFINNTSDYETYNFV